LEGSFSEIERGCGVRNPFVASKLDAKYRTAELTISGELRNVSHDPVKGVLHAEVDGIELQQPVETERRRIEDREVCAGTIYEVKSWRIRGCGGHIRWGRRIFIRRS